MEQIRHEVSTRRDFANKEMVYCYELHIPFAEVTNNRAKITKMLKSFDAWWKTGPASAPEV